MNKYEIAIETLEKEIRRDKSMMFAINDGLNASNAHIVKNFTAQLQEKRDNLKIVIEELKEMKGVVVNE